MRRDQLQIGTVYRGRGRRAVRQVDQVQRGRVRWSIPLGYTFRSSDGRRLAAGGKCKARTFARWALGVEQLELFKGEQ